MISVPYTEYLKFRKNWILYTRILTKKYHIPELKWPEIPYTQNPWLGLNHLWTSVSFADLGSYISLLGLLTNYLILRRSLQQCWGIFANWSQLKVEKTVVCFTDVYWAIRRVNRAYFMAARRYEISLRVLKNIFEHEKINFVSLSGHVMFYLLYN